MSVLLVFVSVTIFTLMLTIGINHSLEQLLSLWHQRDLLLRGLLAALVIVPATFFLLLLIFDLPPAVATGFALLAAAPGAPLTTKRSQMVGADANFISSLQLILAFMAVIVTPAILSIFYTTFDIATQQVSLLDVAWQIGKVTFLPVIVGLSLRYFLPKLVESIAKYINMLANILFLLLVFAILLVLILSADLRAQLLLGWPAFIAIFIAGSSTVVIGHLLGGPRSDQRTGLAIACLARNIGLAIFIAGLAGNAEAIFPTLLIYILLGTTIQVLYTIWIKRQNTSTGN